MVLIKNKKEEKRKFSNSPNIKDRKERNKNSFINKIIVENYLELIEPVMDEKKEVIYYRKFFDKID